LVNGDPVTEHVRIDAKPLLLRCVFNYEVGQIKGGGGVEIAE
jgi:hypothetical protein